jgi:hypothetical protein
MMASCIKVSSGTIVQEVLARIKIQVNVILKKYIIWGPCFLMREQFLSTHNSGKQ